MLEAKEKKETYYNELILLLNSVANGKEYFLNSEIDYSLLYKLAKKHVLANICYIPLLKAGLSEELLSPYINEYNAINYNSAMQSYYTEIIIKSLNENGLKFLPLKGYILKNLYPKGVIRFSSDLDIFYEKKYRKKVNLILKELGFELIGTSGNHDEFMIKGKMTVEMHYSLMAQDDILNKYYKNIWDKLIPTETNEYKFTDEDYFIFMILHLLKHYISGGTGIRSILDVYIYTKVKDNMNWNYINSELESVKLFDFTMEVIKLSQQWFGEEKSNEQINTYMAEHILESGIYGSMSNTLAYRIYKDSQKGGKISYFFRRLFPSYELMKLQFIVLEKHAYLLPIYYIVRLFSAIFSKEKKNKIKTEINTVKNTNEEQLEKCGEFLTKSKLI